MATTQYIGSRYVPLFADPAEWNNTRAYEPLTIVLHEGNSYTSKQYVPKGIDISNTDFWVETGNYNAQVEQYRKDVLDIDSLINGTVVPAVNQNSENIKTEIEERKKADTALQNGIEDLSVFVTPEMYGAKGDGTTNDTNAVQSALDSGKTVFLPKNKKYFVDALTMPNKGILLGSGWSSGIVFSGSTDTLFDMSYKSGVVIMNLSITGTYTSNCFKYYHDKNNVPKGGTNTWSHNYYNLIITNFGCVEYIPYTTSYAANDYCSEIIFNGCKLFNNKRVVYCDNIQALNNGFYNCQLERNRDEEYNDEPLIEISSGEFTFNNCSIIFGKQMIRYITTKEYFQVTPTINIVNCRSELNNNYGDDEFNIIDTTAIKQDATYIFLNIKNYLLINVYGNQNAIANFANVRCRGFVNFDSITIQNAYNFKKFNVIKCEPKAGYTASATTTYLFISIKNVYDTSDSNTLSFDVHNNELYAARVSIEGAKFCGVSGSGLGSISYFDNSIKLNAQSVYGSVGTNNLKLGDTYKNKIITGVKYICNSAQQGLATGMGLYIVKDKEKWTNPSASAPSDDDKTLIYRMDKPVQTYGVINAERVDTKSMTLIGTDSDYTEGRYQIAPLTSNNPIGMIEIELY